MSHLLVKKSSYWWYTIKLYLQVLYFNVSHIVIWFFRPKSLKQILVIFVLNSREVFHYTIKPARAPVYNILLSIKSGFIFSKPHWWRKVSLLGTSTVDRRFEPQSCQTQDYKIGICCFSTKHAALRRKSRDWSAQDQNNVSEWGDMSTRGLLFQWASTIKIQLSLLIYNEADLIIISLTISLFSPWYNWNIAELVLNNNHSLTHSLKWLNKNVYQR